MTPPFQSRHKVRFGACDAAGIAFYPRIFEMLNAALEDFTETVLGVTFADMHLGRRRGLPTVRLEVDFRHPLRLGESVDIELVPRSVGYASLELQFTFRVSGVKRLEGRSVLAWMNLEEGKSTPWPKELKARLSDIVPPNPPSEAWS